MSIKSNDLMDDDISRAARLITFINNNNNLSLPLSLPHSTKVSNKNVVNCLLD